MIFMTILVILNCWSTGASYRAQNIKAATMGAFFVGVSSTVLLALIVGALS